MSEAPERLRAALADRYEIGEQLGEGGMATVYIAQDIKHDRKVAIKVLRPELAAVIGGERFIAEIRTTASLQHPHILPLFDSGEADKFLYYVMPYVEGESLRDKLDRDKQLPVDEAVRFAKAIASALHYAHQHDVVHRDIKPANILIHAGEPVVADFGIAIAISAAGGGRLTETGMSVGTPHYMSPEQASADRDVDARSDTYALACVLYEMLAGDPPHTGPSAQAVLMRILTENPRDITSVRKAVPVHVRDALSKGLEKLPADRFATAKEFADALTDPGFSYHPVVVDATVQALPAQRVAPTRSRTNWLLPFAGATVGVVLGAIAFGGGGAPRPDAPATRLEMDVQDLTVQLPEVIHVSPTGEHFAFVGDQGVLDGVFIRAADEIEFRHMAGTEDAGFMSFSPDGDWIVFDDIECGLQAIPVSGGATRQILPGMQGGCRIFMNWADENIYFVDVGSGPPRVARVPAAGGTVEFLTKESGALLSNPVPLPDGEGVVYADPDASVLLLKEFDQEESRVLVSDAYAGHFLPTGEFLWVDGEGAIWAAGFDLGSHELEGDAIPVMSGVSLSGGVAPAWSISNDGTLVYLRGVGDTGRGALDRLQVVDFETGEMSDVPIQARRFRNVRWSPDGSSVAFSALEPGSFSGRSSIYTYNLDLRTATRRLTNDGTQAFPVWSPDGSAIAYLNAEDMAGPNASGMGSILSGELWTVNVDGTEARLLAEQAGQDVPYVWDANGILHTGGENTGSSELRRALADSPGEVVTYLDIDGDLGSATVSPDGRYAAFLTSEEVGVGVEIEVRTYPTAGPPIQITQGGGDRPRWSRDGRSIYYWKDDATVDSLMVAHLQLEPTLRVLSHELVLAGDYATSTWDLHPEGDRMIVAVPEALLRGEENPTDAVEPQFVVTMDWFTELRAMLDGGS